MTQTDKMLARKEGGVGYLIFNNPERHNAVSLEMWQAASSFLADFAADTTIRVVVLTGAGGKAFVSGADISKFESERSSKEAIDRYNQAVDLANTAVYEFPKPTIAMIRGYCDEYGINIDDETLRARAIEWAATRGARSGRVAIQFVRNIAGEQGKAV